MQKLRLLTLQVGVQNLDSVSELRANYPTHQNPSKQDYIDYILYSFASKSLFRIIKNQKLYMRIGVVQLRTMTVS